MKSKGVYHGCIHVPIYGWNVFVFSGEITEQTEFPVIPDWMKKKLTEKQTVAGLFLSDSDSLAMCIWIGSKKQRRERKLIEAVTHEVFHATYLMLDYAGVKMCEHTEEAFAYLNGYLNNQVFTIMR